MLRLPMRRRCFGEALTGAEVANGEARAAEAFLPELLLYCFRSLRAMLSLRAFCLAAAPLGMMVVGLVTRLQ